MSWRCRPANQKAGDSGYEIAYNPQFQIPLDKGNVAGSKEEIGQSACGMFGPYQTEKGRSIPCVNLDQ